MRALTGLGQAGKALQAAQHHVKGKPDEMPLSRIMRDPNNPRPPLHSRTPEEQQKQRELNANIRKRGVKSPISLRAHPTIPDMWIINHGHGRYDAAEAADHSTIPYFIDPNFDSYDQVAENLHRTDLSPWAIAEFIKRKLEEKQTKGQIAEGLGKENESYITEHLALIDAPQCLHTAYRNGVRSTRTLYDLRRAYEEFPKEVESWCNSTAKVTRGTIQELLKALRCACVQVQPNVVPPSPPSQVEAEFRHDEKTPPVSSSPTTVAMDSSQGKSPSENPLQFLSVTKDAHVDVTLTDSSSPQATATFRHDEKTQLPSESYPTSAASCNGLHDDGTIRVLYKGKLAKIAASTTVKIVVEGHDAPLRVQLSELVFDTTK